MPVICYNLSGTESTSVTIQSEEEKAQSVIDAINEIATSSRPAKPAEYARALYDHLGSAAKAKVTNYSDLLAYERRNQEYSLPISLNMGRLFSFHGKSMESFHNLMVLQALCSFIGNYFVFPIMQSLKGQLYLEQSAKKVFIILWYCRHFVP